MAAPRFAFRSKLYLAAGIIVFAAVPLVFDDFIVHRFSMAVVWAVAIVGLNLLVGFAGQFSIGHAAFCTIGSYLAAIALGDTGWPIPVALFGSFVGTGLIGFLFGWPALRLGTMQMALVTLGLILVVPQVLKSRYLEAWTGGVQGLYVDRPEVSPALGISSDLVWYGLVVALFLLVAWLARNLVAGRSGRAIRAIRDDELAALPMGINVRLLKPAMFGISAAYAGLAGGLAVVLTDFVSPESFGIFFSILLLVGAVAGGVESIFGALFGGLLVEFLPDLARTASGELSFPLYGILLIGLIYLMPRGFAPAAAAFGHRLANLAARMSIRRR